MKKRGQQILWWTFGILATLIGLYPLIYFVLDRRFGLLSLKSQDLLSDPAWNVGFYGHIILGGIALFIGWLQFSHLLRKTKIELHRRIGKIYTIAALSSGACAIYVAQFATGGVSNVIGFSLSGAIWLATTSLGFRAIRRGQIIQHRRFMTYSYALCFSAVTLRIWLPLLTTATGDFSIAYGIVGWLSWVPNLLVAYLILRRATPKMAAQPA